MQFDELPEPAHPLVALRPIVAADLPVWYAYLSLPAVYEHTSWNLKSAGDLSAYVWGPHASAPSTALRLAIALRSTNQLVGTIGFHTVSAENRSAEIAYDLAPAMWGRGIATHLCGVLVAWAHTDARLVRVQATVLESNERSARVLQRCGFEREGLLRSYRQVRGRPGNFWMYSHLQP
ncbi:GNAT family protein [Piscinibacter sp. XHJ-5]|uniref:GNAT family N-acetyltransferase n=1 Tax=Piscinibacter sp. XHJ-5 TaxID=3037797 RepID=UPI0024530101|nr:GNAT family protein [Piscinibacter sp. XHJ-5]